MAASASRNKRRRLAGSTSSAEVALKRSGSAGAAVEGPQRGAPISDSLVVAVLGLAIALVLLGKAKGIGDVPGVETFVLVFASIVIEALPFILLGALVSGLIAVYVPERVFSRIARLPLALQLPGAAVGALAFPVCECGSVPVARRLIARGVHPAAGIAFMLAAPILNPIVLVSTWLAYRGRGLGAEMVLGRAGLGLALAAVAGWAIGRQGAAVLRQGRGETGGHGAPCHGHESHRRRGEEFVGHFTGDFLFMGKFIVIGAALAALYQTVVSQSIVSGVAGTVVVSALALMALAFMLSLCSEADAFVAVSFTAFPLGSQLAFLVFGPIADMKLALLYSAAFRRAFVLRLVLVAVPVIVVGALLFYLVVR